MFDSLASVTISSAPRPQQCYIRPISVGEQEHLKLAPVESEGREKQKRLEVINKSIPGATENYQSGRKTCPERELLDQYLGIGETLMQFRTKNPKINTLLRTTPLILLLLYLGQSTRCLILKPFIVISFLPLGVQTNFGQQTKSVMQVLY